MMSANMASPGLLKITVFWSKEYDIIISADDVTNKILSRDSNYTVDVSCDQSLVTAAFLWEKLSQHQFYKDLTRKTAFFEGWSWFRFNNLGQALGTNLKFYTSVAKGSELKVRKLWGLTPLFVEVTGEKLVGGGEPFAPSLPPPILNRVNKN